jgi:O-succinylbenzoic acid--CoA ligase
LDRYPVTHLSLVASMLDALLAQRSTPPPPTLRVVLLGGGPIDERLVRQALDAGWPVCPSYGLSENASQVATLCRLASDWMAGDVGRPLDGLTVQIVDSAGRPTSGEGRIRLAGPTVMAGYANSAWSFGHGLDDGAFTTMDLGRIDDRGHLRLLGRADDVIVSGGENIRPDQVEALLRACPGIDDVGVVGMPDARWGERVVAAYAGGIEIPELDHWCRTQVPSPLRPRYFVRLDRLPRNALGKLDRSALRRRLAQRPG